MRFSLRVKVVAAVLLMALAVAGVTVLVSYNMYARSMDDHYEQLTVNTAKSAASMVDAAAVAELTERTLEIYRGLCPDENTPPDFDSFDEADWAEYFAAFDEIAESPAYQETFAILNALKEDNGVLWLYVAYMDAQTGQGIYIVDADCKEDGDKLRDLVLEKRPNAKIVRQIVGPVIGAHCGPGTLGVIFTAAKRPIPLNKD